MSTAGPDTADALAERAPLRLWFVTSGRFTVTRGRGAHKKASLFRYTITTPAKADPVKVAALARAIDRLDLSACGPIETVEVVVEEGCIQLSMRSAGHRRRVLGGARRLFAQVWYDALGEQPDESWSVESSHFR